MSSGRRLVCLQVLALLAVCGALPTEKWTDEETSRFDVSVSTDASELEDSSTPGYSYFDEEDMLMTTLKSKKEIDTPTTEASTLPLIDGRDFLSKVYLTSTKYVDMTNALERTAKEAEDSDPLQLPKCDDSVDEGSEDYAAPDLSFDLEDRSLARATSEDGWSDPDIVNSTDASVTVSWKAPTSNITVLYYVVEWGHSGTNVGACRSSNETFEHTINKLQSCTKYDVSVTPYTEENGQEQKRVVSVKTGLIVTKDSLNLKISGNSTDWLKITWNVPNAECVEKYVITHCHPANCSTVDTNETAYNATELIPCTKYNFTVSVHGQSGEYGSTNIDSETDFLQPGQPTPAWTEPGKNLLKIFWTSPVGASCIIYYRVTVALDGKPQITKNCTDNETTIDSLGSCKVYDVTIVPVHRNGDAHPEIIRSNRTFPAVLSPPDGHWWPEPTSNAVRLKWLVYTNEDNNCENTNITTECRYIRIFGSGYNGTNGSSVDIIAQGSHRIVANVSIQNLSPFTKYHCFSIAENSQGRSRPSSPVLVHTLEDVPSAPKLSVAGTTDTQFTLNWEAPQYLPGNLTIFEIDLIGYPNFHPPRWCEDLPETPDKITKIDGDIFTWPYERAMPFSNYRVRIRASTHVGWGNYSDYISFNTLAGAPGPVSYLNYTILPNDIDQNILDFVLSWGAPCYLHGDHIEEYNVTAVGERRNFEPHAFTELMSNGKTNCEDHSCLRKLKLKEEYTYTFYVTARVKGYREFGEKNSVTAIYPAGIPPAPDANYTSQISIDPYKARRTTTTATVLLPVFPDTYGQIRCYAIIVAKSGYNNASYSRIDLNSGEWPDTPSWVESMSADFTIPYQAVKFCDQTNPSYIVDYGRIKAVKYVLGDDTETCPHLSSNCDERSYCNGPLKPDTWYHVRMRAFTSGGYRDSAVFTVKTNAELRVAIVIGTIFGILFLGIITTMMLLVRKCSLQAVLRRFLHSDMPGSPVPAPFTRRKFIAHCQQLADNPGKLSNEFQLLQTLSVDLQMPTNAACLQANRKKNRYTDILPYDFSRVKLEAIDTDPNSDYINASFIKGFSGEEEYIACQGPKEETTYDFWRMIDQYDVKLIVMLTQLVEKNKEKCHQYYPVARETFTYENMSIRCTTEYDYRTYTQRTLILQKENEKRTIIHLHFKDWPDHDVPEDFDPMINFCQIMRRYITANPGLAVIHCSAGIGRTGTLIAIDILLQHIKENRKLDVFGTVYRLRHHRINMVQRESQYAYIYNCIRQVLKNPYFSKTYKPPSVDPIMDNNCNTKKKDTSITNLVSSLETLKKSSLSTSVESAEQIFNSSSSTSSSSPKSHHCLSLQGLRYSKSTSAICSKPCHGEIVRYNTLDFPVYEVEREGKSSTTSLDDSEGSTSSFYENLQPINRSKSTHSVTDDPTVTEKLLDTSL